MGSSVAASIDGFCETLVSMAEDVAKQDQEELMRRCKKAGSSCAKTLRKTSPHESGKYASGWRYEMDETDEHITVTVYNPKHYQLTHLLEKGHELFFMGNDTGHRTRAFPHIAPAYEDAKREVLGG